jgi:hypothetical protein
VLGLYRRVELTLVLLRQNLNQMAVGDWFGVSQPTVSRIYRAMLPLIEQVTCVHRPPLPEVLQGRVVLVDGTLVPVGNRRTDRGTHLQNFSGKRHRAGLSVQVLADLSGCLLAVSTPVPGTTHDRAAFTAAGYDHLLANTPTLGDLGYQGTPVIRPRRRPPGRDHHPHTEVCKPQHRHPARRGRTRHRPLEKLENPRHRLPRPPHRTPPPHPHHHHPRALPPRLVTSE